MKTARFIDNQIMPISKLAHKEIIQHYELPVFYREEED